MALPVYERNMDALHQSRQNDINRETQGYGPFILNPKPGRTTFRVMGPWDERGNWYFEFREHSFFTGGKDATPFVCTQESQGRCPICEYGAALDASGDQEAAMKFRPKTQFFLNTLVFSDSSNKNTIKSGVIVMQVGVMVKKALLNLDLDVNGGYGDITNYETGFDINMDKEGSGLKTKYTVNAYPQRNSVLARLAAEGIDPESLELHALDQIRPELAYDDLVSEFETVMQNKPQVPATPAPVARPAPKPVQTTVAPVKTTSPIGHATFAKPTGPTIGGVKIAPPPLPGRK